MGNSTIRVLKKRTLNRRETLRYLEARKYVPSLIEQVRKSVDRLQYYYLRLENAIQKAKAENILK